MIDMGGGYLYQGFINRVVVPILPGNTTFSDIFALIPRDTECREALHNESFSINPTRDVLSRWGGEVGRTGLKLFDFPVVFNSLIQPIDVVLVNNRDSELVCHIINIGSILRPEQRVYPRSVIFSRRIFGEPELPPKLYPYRRIK